MAMDSEVSSKAKAMANSDEKVLSKGLGKGCRHSQGFRKGPKKGKRMNQFFCELDDDYDHDDYGSYDDDQWRSYGGWFAESDNASDFALHTSSLFDTGVSTPPPPATPLNDNMSTIEEALPNDTPVHDMTSTDNNGDFHEDELDADAISQLLAADPRSSLRLGPG